jgi:hypothetical protein
MVKYTGGESQRQSDVTFMCNTSAPGIGIVLQPTGRSPASFVHPLPRLCSVLPCLSLH